MKLTARLAGLTLGALAACAVPPGVALAQSPRQAAEVAATKGGQAAPLFEEGNRAADEMRWADAEAAYLKAWAIVRSFDVAANLGEVELRLGKPRLAAVHLAFSLRTAPPSAKAPNLERTRFFLGEAKKLIGVVRARVTPPDAEVLVDGKALPEEETAEEIFLEPGTHRITARRGGYIEGEKVVTVAAGTAQEVTLALAERPAASEAGPATVPDRTTANTTLVLRARPAEERAGGPRTAVLIGGATTAGAAAVAGVVFTVLAVTKGNDAETQRDALVRASGLAACSRAGAPAACSNLREADDAHIRWANGAILSFAAAGAMGAGTAIYWLVTRPSEGHGRVHAMPIVGANGFGLSVSGGF
ncbi:uncharacterized protein SOCEGT47_011640 [Sorangium cellulosum]|uniref:PEGA domain-containing protein n=1 Tax=Sorangium cellulosum TaxID=56 RepID=A0A4P2PVV0_SORCE|nr:PEGA domain-containing protein [Sorangium cellulosum]AUX20691.1 uncharacterized protein SOCEGT47_011640 [Sorangium cellulosum]